MASDTSKGMAGITWSPACLLAVGPGAAGWGRDDAAAGAGTRAAELLVFQGELVDYAHEGGRLPGASLGWHALARRRS
jgi:hypothetical protein